MLDTFLNNSLLQAVAITMVVMVLERLIQLPAAYHPITLMRGFAETVGDKAVNGKQQSATQLTISGALAIVVLSMPLVLIVASILLFAEYTVFFDALLLLFALQYSPILEGSKAIQKALEGRKKALARNLLGKWTLRETSALSEFGICKAIIESLLLRFSYQYMSVLFWYLVAGGAGAIMYRFIYEISHTWNIKIKAYEQYGSPASWLCFGLQWIPVRITALLFVVAVNIGKALSAFKSYQGKASTHTLLLTSFGGALDIQLGGPAYYGKYKIRLPKCGGVRTPELIDIARARVAIYQTQGLFVAMLFLAAAGIYSIG